MKLAHFGVRRLAAALPVASLAPRAGAIHLVVEFVAAACLLFLGGRL